MSWISSRSRLRWSDFCSSLITRNDPNTTSLNYSVFCLKEVLDSVDWTTLFSAVHSKFMPEKFINLRQPLYSNIFGHFTLYGELSSLFESNSGLWQRCFISLFLFRFLMDVMMEDAFWGLQRVGIELSNKKLSPRLRRRPCSFVQICETCTGQTS